MRFSNYNFEIQPDNSCDLVGDLQPYDYSQLCKQDPNRVSYFEGTRYRRNTLTTCVDGLMLDSSTEKPCANHESDFERNHPGMGGFTLFLLAFVLPVLLAGGVGFWVWRNWDGKFGRIRLGDGTSAFDASQPWIQYPVAAVAATIAVLAALPLLVASVWRSLSGLFGGGRRYTTRQSFARGRGDYAIVDPDEDELLGDEDEDDV